MFYENNGSIDAETYINGFPLMPNNEIPTFLIANNLSFTVEQLIFIRDYYRNEKKALPTYNQILFFDTLNRIRKSQKKEYCIYSANAEEGANAIMQSSKDLLSKQKVIKRTYSGAMPLSFAAEIASKYLNSIGYRNANKYFLSPKYTKQYEYYIHTADNSPLFVYSNNASANSEQATSNSLHNTIAMLCPIDSAHTEDYQLHINELLSLPEVNSIISNHKTINGNYGIFDVLLQETNGIFVNLSNIPQIEKNENGKVLYLTSLLSDCLGKHIFSTNNTSIDIINRIAEHYSLKIYAFAMKNNSGLLTLESTKNPSFSFSFSFLRRIMEFKEHSEYVFTNETNLPIEKKENVYITDNTKIPSQTYSAEKILNFGKIISTASSRELNLSPHKSAAITVMDSINALIAKGIYKNSISLSIHYSLLCGTDESRELGKNLASVLGAYRSMIELCIADNEPQIDYNTQKRSITVLASAKSPKKQIKSTFSNGASHIYFYKQSFSEDGLPDYQSYRDFIKHLFSLFEDDIILSAISVNENFLTVFQNAAQNSNVQLESNFDLSSLTDVHGILFETREMIAINKDIFYIGITEEK